MLELSPLENVTIQQVREELGPWGSRIPWVNRGATRAADLDIQARILLIGPMGLGKSREAVELIERSVARALVLPTSIYKPAKAVYQLSEADIQKAVANEVGRDVSTLLYLDDLLRQFPGESIIKLDVLVNGLRQQSRRFFFVATARLDQWEHAHQTWIDSQSVQQQRLQTLDAEQLVTFVENALRTFGMQADAAAQAAFVAGSDGTPGQIMSVLYNLHEQGIRQPDPVLVRSAMQQATADTWKRIRRMARERYEAAGYLFEALAEFHAAGATPYTGLIMAYATYLWGQAQRRYSSRPGNRALQGALTWLAASDIAPSRGRVTYREASVEGVFDKGNAQNRFDEARYHFQERVRLEPDTALNALVSLGILARLTSQSESEDYLLQALGLWEKVWQARLQSEAGLLASKPILSLPKKPQITQITQIFLSGNFASLRLCVSFFQWSQCYSSIETPFAPIASSASRIETNFSRGQSHLTFKRKPGNA